LERKETLFGLGKNPNSEEGNSLKGLKRRLLELKGLGGGLSSKEENFFSEFHGNAKEFSLKTLKLRIGGKIQGLITQP